MYIVYVHSLFTTYIGTCIRIQSITYIATIHRTRSYLRSRMVFVIVLYEEEKKQKTKQNKTKRDDTRRDDTKRDDTNETNKTRRGTKRNEGKENKAKKPTYPQNSKNVEVSPQTDFQEN